MGARILVLPGTAEPGSPEHRLAFEIARLLAPLSARLTLLNLADYPLPLFDPCAGPLHDPPRQALQLAERIADEDAFVLVTPEANGSVPPLAKNAIDWTASVERVGARPIRPFSGLVVGLASASPGLRGDFPALAAWRPVFATLGAALVETSATLAGGPAAFADDRPLDTEAALRLEAFATEFLDTARSLARHPPPF